MPAAVRSCASRNAPPSAAITTATPMLRTKEMRISAFCELAAAAGAAAPPAGARAVGRRTQRLEERQEIVEVALVQLVGAERGHQGTGVADHLAQAGFQVALQLFASV